MRENENTIQNKRSAEWKMQIFMKIYLVYIWTIDNCTLF